MRFQFFECHLPLYILPWHALFKELKRNNPELKSTDFFFSLLCIIMCLNQSWCKMIMMEILLVSNKAHACIFQESGVLKLLLLIMSFFLTQFLVNLFQESRFWAWFTSRFFSLRSSLTLCGYLKCVSRGSQTSQYLWSNSNFCRKKCEETDTYHSLWEHSWVLILLRAEIKEHKMHRGSSWQV